MPVCAFKSFENPPALEWHAYPASEGDSPSRERPDFARIESAEVAVRSPRDGARAVLETLRQTLAFEGLHESRSQTQEGFYFTIEDDEVCLTYAQELHGIGPRDGDARTAPARYERVVLNCCDALARRGFAFTLFMSPRTVALRVRTD